MLYRATSDMPFSPPEKEISLYRIANVPREEVEGISKIITQEYKQIYFRLRERRGEEGEGRRRKGIFYLYYPGMSQIKRCFRLYFPGMSPYTNTGFKYLFLEALNHTETRDSHGESSPNYHVSSTLNTLSSILTITL